MIYYPLSTLMSLGVREFLIITTERDLGAFVELLADGSQWGVEISFAVQAEPRGIAEALLIGAHFLDGHGCALILGDNIFHGGGLIDKVKPHMNGPGATALALRVVNAQQYGIVEIDDNGIAVGIEEKPTSPKSQLAIPGLYLLDERAPALAQQLQPSARGEL
jgi:glucose-1-phosphate thymidylyltransferase